MNQTKQNPTTLPPPQHICTTREDELQLNQIPLTDVMSANNHAVHHFTKDNFYYRCPVSSHKDENASFSVSRTPVINPYTGDATQGAFKCHGCGVSGYGAISLQAVLLGYDHKNLTSQQMQTVIARLLHNHQIRLTSGAYIPSVAFREETTPVSTIQWTECPWTDAHLRALGCQVQDVFVMDDETEEWENSGQKTYSWGRDFYNMLSEHRADNLDFSQISETFGIYPVESYVIPPSRTDSHSKRIIASDTMPAFIIRMRDSLGNERIRTYCPLDKTKYKWGNYLYNRVSQVLTFKSSLNGDADIIKSLYSQAEPQDTSGNHPVVEVIQARGGDYVQKRKFRNVCICSGPRDAMQVYYHSDCHVVYPQSEKLSIDADILKRLRDIAETIYILFDSDKAGREASIALNMNNVDMHNVELPADLKEVRSQRTGNPCKDASEYFEHYAGRCGDTNINNAFRRLLNESPSLRFFESRMKGNKTDRDAGVERYSYDLMSKEMTRFLFYSGMGNVVDSKSKRADDTIYRTFFFESRNIISFLGRDDRKVKARELMMAWGASHGITDPHFSDTVMTSRKVCDDIFNALPVVDLNLRYWSDHHQYTPLQDVVACTTAEGTVPVSYDDVDCVFESRHIRSFGWSPEFAQSPFSIVRNDLLEQKEMEHNERLEEVSDDPVAMQGEIERWQQTRDVYAYHLHMNIPMNDCAHYLQYAYDTGRVFWRNEEESRRNRVPKEYWLSPEQHQIQDAHFISKVAALGYLLSRYRTSAMPYTVVAMDHSNENLAQSNGRTGKSLFTYCLDILTHVIHKAGKQVYTSSDKFNQNFKDVDPQYTGVVDLSDPEAGFPIETLNNVSEGIMSIKLLHRDEINIPEDRAPKLYISYNRDFDTSSKTVSARLWELSFSDYYYPDGPGIHERSPRTKFGTDFKNLQGDQQVKTIAFLFACLQFHFQTMGRVYAPQDDLTAKRKLYAVVKDLSFITWADRFFANESVYGYPVAINDIVSLWYTYKGKPVTKTSIQSEGRILLMKNIRLYCDKRGISINPRAVFRNATDARDGSPRTATFQYAEDTNGYIQMGQRVRKSDTRVCYFYHRGQEPSSIEEVLRNPKDDITLTEE